jgi:flagellar motor switch protein FliN/FliY
MSEFTTLTSVPTDDAAAAAADGLQRLAQVRVELSVEIGRTTMSLGEALALGPGSVIALDRMADQPVDLLVNGKLVARGEVVVIDSEYGLRVTEVVGAEQDAPADAPPADAPVADAAPAADGPVDQAAIDAAIAASAAGDGQMAA